MVHFGTAEAWSWDMIFPAISLVKNGLGNAEEHQRVAQVSRHTGRLSSTVVHKMFCLHVRSEVTADEKQLCNQRAREVGNHHNTMLYIKSRIKDSCGYTRPHIVPELGHLGKRIAISLRPGWVTK